MPTRREVNQLLGVFLLEVWAPALFSGCSKQETPHINSEPEPKPPKFEPQPDLDQITRMETRYFNLFSKFPLAFAATVKAADQYQFDRSFALAVVLKETDLLQRYARGRFENGNEIQLVTPSGERGLLAIKDNGTYAAWVSDKKDRLTNIWKRYNSGDTKPVYTLEDMDVYDKNLDVGLTWLRYLMADFAQNKTYAPEATLLALNAHNKGRTGVRGILRKYSRERQGNESPYHFLHRRADDAVILKSLIKYKEQRDYVPIILGHARAIHGLLGKVKGAAIPEEGTREHQTWRKEIGTFLVDPRAYLAFDYSLEKRRAPKKVKIFNPYPYAITHYEPLRKKHKGLALRQAVNQAALEVLRSVL